MPDIRKIAGIIGFILFLVAAMLTLVKGQFIYSGVLCFAAAIAGLCFRFPYWFFLLFLGCILIMDKYAHHVVSGAIGVCLGALSLIILVFDFIFMRKSSRESFKTGRSGSGGFYSYLRENEIVYRMWTKLKSKYKSK
jgi:hypothetical protein